MRPSPPSATGKTITFSSGLSERIPLARASEASLADKDPLKESSATKTVIKTPFAIVPMPGVINKKIILS